MAESTPSAVPGGPAAPAVAFAEWLPALGGSRLLRIHGHDSPHGLPTLVLRTPAGEVHIEPRAQPRFTREHEWRASFLIPAEIVSAGWAETALEWPEGTRLPLPDPPAQPRAEVIDPTVLTTLRARRTAPDSPEATAAPTPEDIAPPPPEATAVSPPDDAAPTEVSPPDDAAPTNVSPPDDAVAPPPEATDVSPPDDAAPPPPEVVSSSSAATPEVVTPSPEGAMSPSPHTPGGGSWIAPPEAFSGSVFEAEAVWTARRAELERELARAATSIARAREGERAAREAVLAALANARADLRAVRAARAADESAVATLKAELDAERIAHAVTRAIAKDLRSALAEARGELQARGRLEDAAEARGEAAGLRSALEAERTARTHAEEALRAGSELMRRIAGNEDLERRAREQAETAATAARRPPEETGRLLADLDAAAAALRAAAPAPEVSTPSVPAPDESEESRAVPAAGESVESLADVAARESVESPADPAAGASVESPAVPAAGESVESPAVPAAGESVESRAIPAAGESVESRAVPAAGESVESPADPAAGESVESPADVAAGDSPAGVAAGESVESPADVAAGDSPADVAAGDSPAGAPAGESADWPVDLAAGDLTADSRGVSVGDRVADSPNGEAAAESSGGALVVAGSGPARSLRVVLVELARQDPLAAGEILVGLLPAQGAVLEEAIAYDLTVRGVGTFAISVENGAAQVQRVSQPRARGEAAFHLVSDPLTLARLLAGEERRIGRFTGRARVTRRRRRARALRALPAAGLSLAAAVRAGARVEPALVYRALPLAIDPAWTKGHAFTVAQEITGPAAHTWYLTIRDGAGLEVTDEAPPDPPDATVTMTRTAFDRLLRDEPPAPGERPLVRGNRAAVAILKAWTDRARGA